VLGEVVALFEPRLEEEVDALEILDPCGADLGLELLDDRTIEALDRAVRLLGVGRRERLLDPEMREGEGEVV